MRPSTVIRRFARQAFVPALCLPVMAFFLHHALFDAHGMRRLLALNESVAKQGAVLEEERAKRAALEANVDALDGPRIDPDLLDERARATLGLARPDEIIIFRQK